MNPHSNKPKDSGMVLIFVIATIFTLVVLLGLFLDVGTMMIAKRDREKTARLVSSEAISVFNRTPANPDGSIPEPKVRMSSAKKSSETLATTNLNLQFAKAFFLKKNEQQDFSGDAKSSGSLVPGIWYFNQQGVVVTDAKGNSTCPIPPINNISCPCKDLQWNGPCFRPLPGLNDQASAAKVNAFSADLRTKDGNKMQTTFMSIAGQKEVALKSQSTIAIRPLNVVVLVDLSRFVDEETHIPYEVVGLKGLTTNPPTYNPARFAYPISGRPSCLGSEPMTDIGPLADFQITPAANEAGLTCKRNIIVAPSTPTTPVGNWNKVNSTCTLKGGDYIAPNFYSDIFNMIAPQPNMFYAQRPTPATPDTYHTKFDYRCVTMNFQRVNGTKNLNEPYLVDFRRTPTYRGPEPLETFIQATRESLAKIKNRNLRGDSISVVGFDWDSEVKRRRILNLNPIDTKGTFDNTVKYFSDPRNAATVKEKYELQRNRYQDLGFAPRITNRFLSIPQALNQAYTILKNRPNFATADNMVILLTTGLTNCVKNGDTDQTCGQKTSNFADSIDHSIKFAEDYLKKQGILLHILLRSPRVQPITKIIKTPKSCKVEENALGFSYPDKYNFTSAIPAAPKIDTPLDNQTGTFNAGVLKFTTPFQVPNNLAKATMATGGVWAPIRPPCVGTAATAITDFCATGKVTPGITDADGNILCDTKGDSPEIQTTNYIEKMFDVTPLIPVSEGVVVN